ncbi:MAG: hypothetical protein KA120_05800 [Candidatus Goldbacteria bacterium]|nr:hypothetical protein [Candidatus Goldiibacteriota bacterium]
MKKMKKFMLFSFLVFFISSTYLYSEAAQQKTDFKIGAKIIGVADPDYKEFSYIDMGTAHGVKPGDRFMVEGKFGKVMVEVVQSFQRMSSVKIVDSWLLNEGNSGEMIPESRYPKIRIAKYVEKSNKDTVLSGSKSKKSKTKTQIGQSKKTSKTIEEILPEEVISEALPPEVSAKAETTESMSLDMGMEFPEMEIPGDEMSVGELETVLPGEDALPVINEPIVEDIGLPADMWMEPGLPEESGLPADMWMEPGLPEELGLPADNDLIEPSLPSDDLSVMPGEALPPMP